MNLSKVFISFLIFAVSFLSAQEQAPDYLRYVSTLVGTDSEYSLSNGNTYPAIAMPFGMHFWSPMTTFNYKDGWFYKYDDYQITGFKQTHQPSPWINDYGAFTIMPGTGEVITTEKERASFFSHKTETARPDYYKVFLADYNLTAEITPTPRGAQFRFGYPANSQSWILFDLYDKNCQITVSPEEGKIRGVSQYSHGGTTDNFRNYFVAEVNKKIQRAWVWNDDKTGKGKLETIGKRIGAVICFETAEGEKVEMKIASSFISMEQAELNLQREIGSNSFDATRKKATDSWNRELGTIEVEGEDDSRKVTFYSAYYRCLLFPRMIHEINRSGDTVHFSPFNGQIEKGVLFTDNGFWDTFRSAFPLITLLRPSLNAHMMQGLANTYRESGWLPEWASPGHRDCMIGSNSASLIADSWLKGIRGYDINLLWEALVKNSQNEGPLSSVGRKGVHYYNQLGYIPYDLDIPENAARTLEYSYDDYCLWKLATSLGKPQAIIDTFAKRAQYYRNLYDPATRFMRGRNQDGSFQSPFNPYKWGDAFTEGNAWHYTWSVFHDPDGLIGLMGGKASFNAKMDSVFTAPPLYDFSYYGVRIHEITEMLIAGMGQYAHGNQPVQHALYLYAWSGEPWKIQQRVRQVMNQLYTPAPDGYCGDEDNGQTSAWYVFSAMGFYPVCPGSGEYVLGTPLFDRISLHFENGKTFIIDAPQQNEHSLYIGQARLNEMEWTKNYIRHNDLINGGMLQMQMQERPNRSRGTKDEDRPYSMSR
jgi:predicted alpha-1,2-mannosidase